MAESENPYRAGQQLTNTAAANHVWKEGPYLVVHAIKSALPNRCLYCDGPSSWQGRVAFRRPVTGARVLGLIFFAPMSLLVYSTFPTAKPVVCLCAAHARSER